MFMNIPHRILFSKENVFIYPPEVEKGIKGTLSICSLDKGSLYLLWMPANEYSGGNSSNDGNDNNNDTTIQEELEMNPTSLVVRVHIKELKSIKKYTPTIGTPYIIITSKSGTAFYPFFFEQGGVREFLKCLSSIIHLKKSNIDPNFFIVVDLTDPIQRSLSHMNLSESIDKIHDPLADLEMEGDQNKYSLLSSTNHLKKAQEISVSIANVTNNTSNFTKSGLSFSTSILAPPSNVSLLSTSIKESLYESSTMNNSNSYHSGLNTLNSNNDLTKPSLTLNNNNTTTNSLSLSSIISKSPTSTSSSPISINRLAHSGNISPISSPSSKILSESTDSDDGSNSFSTSPTNGSGTPNHRHKLKREFSSSILENFAKVTQLAKSAQKKIFEEPAKNIDNHFRNLMNKTATNSLSPPHSNSHSNNSSGHHHSHGHHNSHHHSHNSNGIPSYIDQLNESSSSIMSSSMDYFTPFNISSSNFSIEIGINRRECNPLSASEWYSYFDEEGRICLANQQVLLKKIFYGGIEDSLRSQVWPFLLHVYSFDSTYASRQVKAHEKLLEYQTLKRQWESISCEQESRFSKYVSRKMLIKKDVIRTDRLHPMFIDGEDELDANPNLKLMYEILLTYSFFNFDIGYVQGMSDLLSPILSVMKNDSDSFWCFKGLMDRLESNFHKDQNGMHTQLSTLSKLIKFMDNDLFNHLEANNGSNMYFFFQSVLICFKREFCFSDVKCLWEVLWSNYLTKQLPIFMCLSIILKEREKILSENMAFDLILKLVNEKANKMDLDELLIDAESLVKYFIIKQPSNDPSLLALKQSISIGF
ncbi:hypothetical protein CYY_006745 [Polysphondylium violaceum]|uniref:Rab-GAP TBC domain-containing protein n=1 Tax=Polysphondylium violaceum TaxID=133409 RepID=A0A8J4PS03_9MYCE|nr:hypothetical protein CYY_006745 [Polysphondylium violaceum]